MLNRLLLLVSVMVTMTGAESISLPHVMTFFEKFDSIYCDTIYVKAGYPISNPKDSLLLLEKVYNENRCIGYLLYISEYSKSSYMHFILALTFGGSVLGVKILDPGSSIGKKVDTKRFLRQFVNIDSNNSVKLKKNINGITGATYSSRAITIGIRKALDFYTSHLLLSKN